MLDYAVQLTLAPAETNRADIETLRCAGFDDTAILDINLVAGYFAFVNRLADGLGVQLEDFWENTAPGRPPGSERTK